MFEKKKCECGKKLVSHGDDIGVLKHQVFGMRENINDLRDTILRIEHRLEERVEKLEKEVYPPPRRLQGHSR